MTQAGEGLTIYPTEQELHQLMLTHPRREFIKTGDYSQGVWPIRVGTPEGVSGASSGSTSSGTSSGPSGGPIITLRGVSADPTTDPTGAGAPTVPAGEIHWVALPPLRPEASKEMRRIIVGAMVEDRRRAPTTLVDRILEIYPGIDMEVLKRDRDFCEVRIHNPKEVRDLLAISLKEVSDEMIWRSQYLRVEFQTPKTFLDHLHKKDCCLIGKINREKSDWKNWTKSRPKDWRHYDPMDWKKSDLKRGRCVFEIERPELFRERPEIAKRVRQVIATAKQNPGTRFFETEEVYGALSRIYGSEGFLDGLLRPTLNPKDKFEHRAVELCEFRIPNARLLPNPPEASPTSAATGPRLPQGSGRNAARIREITEKITRSASQEDTFTFDVSLDELRQLGEIYPPLEIEPLHRSATGGYLIRIRRPDSVAAQAPELRDIARPLRKAEGLPAALPKDSLSDDSADDGAVTFHPAKVSSKTPAPSRPPDRDDASISDFHHADPIPRESTTNSLLSSRAPASDDDKMTAAPKHRHSRSWREKFAAVLKFKGVSSRSSRRSKEASLLLRPIFGPAANYGSQSLRVPLLPVGRGDPPRREPVRAPGGSRPAPISRPEIPHDGRGLTMKITQLEHEGAVTPWTYHFTMEPRTGGPALQVEISNSEPEVRKLIEESDGREPSAALLEALRERPGQVFLNGSLLASVGRAPTPRPSAPATSGQSGAGALGPTRS